MSPVRPIIFVRGFAPTQADIEHATSDPYMGFNEGSTRLRQRHNGTTVKHLFESPLIRLMKDYGYRDVYFDGRELSEEDGAPEASIWIYRYYDTASEDLGDGARDGIEYYARGLSELIERIRRCVRRDGRPVPGLWCPSTS